MNRLNELKKEGQQRTKAMMSMLPKSQRGMWAGHNQTSFFWKLPFLYPNEENKSDTLLMLRAIIVR